jgi:hypothetical protein
MSLHYVGDRLVLGDGTDPFSAGRFEAIRPDGSRIERDWDKGPWRLKLDQPGAWVWRLYIRDDTGTRHKEGEVIVLSAVRSPGLLIRLFRRRF